MNHCKSFLHTVLFVLMNSQDSKFRDFFGVARLKLVERFAVVGGNQQDGIMINGFDVVRNIALYSLDPRQNLKIRQSFGAVHGGVNRRPVSWVRRRDYTVFGKA
jgi:hypothetical protein